MKMATLRYPDAQLVWVTCLSLILMSEMTSAYSPMTSYDTRCPVMPPCFCDQVGHRYFRSKRIVCGQLGRQFPQFIENDNVVDCISLMYTGLKHIPPEGFVNIRSVHINLQGNNFRDRISDRAFAEMGRTLRGMNLAWSNITTLPLKVFRGMLELRNLTLAENKIGHLSHFIFQDLRSLERLSLAGNHLRVLPATIFRFQTNLLSLDVGYCLLSKLPTHLFAGLWNLRKLDLRGNHIHTLTRGLFTDLWSMEALLLSHNPIKSLDSGSFRGLSNLESLELKESSLESLGSGVFAETRRLTTLDLGDNKLSVIGKGVLNIPSLTWLSLDGNGLRGMPEDVAQMTALIYLDISYNSLTTLDRCMFEKLRSLELVNMRQNPFHCNCTIFWMRTLQMRLLRHWDNARMVPFVPAQCASPRSLKGTGVNNWLDINCMRRNRHLPKCQYDFWFE